VPGPGHGQQGHGARQPETERDRRRRAAEGQRGRQDRPAQAPPDQDRAHGGRQQRAGAEGELEVAGPARGAAEHGEGQDHDQQVQRPDHDGIRGQQGQHEPQPRLTDRQPQPVAEPGGRLLRSRPGRQRRYPQARDEQCGQQAEAGGFHPANDHVGRRQLIGGSGHRRDERGLRRTGSGHRGGGDHGARVSRQRRARADRHGRSRHRRGLRQVSPGEQDHR
jgi:hypothetical protein